MDQIPAVRRLRIFAFDPSLGTRLETSGINELTVEVTWEDDLEKGPIGEYVEVVDADPASGMFYRPVDLNDRNLLAQDGVAPSESNPQFHQQMVYAVAMTTIRHFERALGRVSLWADRRITAGGDIRDQFVRRLRIYPHALRDRNAYYSPAKKALLFGYFPVTSRDKNNTPGTLVFTCLSHDIVAHEVTHALLDGLHPRFNESSNPDVLAFHEAFADIVALFQHFSYPTVLESQIRRTRGNLSTENLLAQLAQQFGQATGRGAALRDALGGISEKTGQWEIRTPDPTALDQTLGPHARGSILVAAVFRAFLLMYRAKTADLFRIASQGTGNLPEGDIHPDLTRRLASEASTVAERILQMCIRALDYCAPVGITFGDFLRAVVTADIEYSPGDKSGYRVVFIESFREWGIYPRGISSLGLDTLAWPRGEDVESDIRDQHEKLQAERVAEATEQANQAAPPASTETKQVGMSAQLTAERVVAGMYRDRYGMQKQLQHPTKTLQTNLQRFIGELVQNWNLESDRFVVWQNMERARGALHKWLYSGDSSRDWATVFGLVIDAADAPPTVYRGRDGQPTVEIHSVRPALRRTIDGSIKTDLVIEITQRRHGYFKREDQQYHDDPTLDSTQKPDFIFRAGATVLIDPRSSVVRRVVRTPGTIADNDELERVRRFLVGEGEVVGNAFDAGVTRSLAATEPGERDEPFALLHRIEED
jgi:hypothetical protein